MKITTNTEGFFLLTKEVKNIKIIDKTVLALLKFADLRGGGKTAIGFKMVIIIVWKVRGVTFRCHYFYFNVLLSRRNILMDINNAENTVLPLPSDKDTLKVKNFCSFHIVRLRKQIQDFISFCKTTQTEADTGLYFIL